MNIVEVRVPLRAVKVYAHCEKCGARIGDAVPNQEYGLFAYDDRGHVSPVGLHRYTYICPECGAKTESDEHYPRIEFLEE